MEDAVTLFCTHFIRLAVSAFICLFTVRKSLRIPVSRVAVYTGLFTLVFSLGIGYFQPDAATAIVAMMSALVCGGIFLVRITDEKRAKLIFLLLIVASYAYFCLSIWGLFYSVIPILDSSEKAYAEIAVCLAVYGALSPVYMFGLSRLWRQALPLKDAPWYRLCIVSCLFITMYFSSITLEESNRIGVLTRSIIDAFITLCAFITFWQMITMLLKSTEAARYAERMRNMDNQLLLQAELLKEVSTHEGEIRKLRHDMRHHFATLESMLGESGNERVLAYLREYIDSVGDASSVAVCENAVADAVCRRYITLASKEGIETDVAASIPERSGVADSDLSVLLGNLWENALEACMRQSAGGRYIRLRVKTTDNSVMISMSNSFDGTTRRRVNASGDSELLSLKRGGTEEGLGIASICAIVRRYRGLDEFSYDAGSFNAKIILYAPDDAGQ